MAANRAFGHSFAVWIGFLYVNRPSLDDRVRAVRELSRPAVQT